MLKIKQQKSKVIEEFIVKKGLNMADRRDDEIVAKGTLDRDIDGVPISLYISFVDSVPEKCVFHGNEINILKKIIEWIDR